MNGCFLLLITVAYFVFFYFVYGKFLSKVFKIDPSRKTPAYTLYDGIDYTPTSPYVLLDIILPQLPEQVRSSVLSWLLK